VVWILVACVIDNDEDVKEVTQQSTNPILPAAGSHDQFSLVSLEGLGCSLLTVMFHSEVLNPVRFEVSICLYFFEACVGC
jgi:hypothetical protein